MFWNKKSNPDPVVNLAKLGIQDALLGDTLSISGAAADFSDVDFTIDRRDYYEAGSKQWFEVSGMWRGQRVFLEVHTDDILDVLGNFEGRRLTLDDFGLTEEDMGTIDERQNPNEFLDFEGKFWMYSFSREVGRFAEGRDTGTGLYRWQFHEQGGNRFLVFNKYEEEPFVAALWTRVNPGEITVFRGA
jgi:hypothetical protein